jgi:hypothetical protein
MAKDSTPISDAEIADVVVILRKTTLPSRRQSRISFPGVPTVMLGLRYSDIFKDDVALVILSESKIDLESLAKGLDADSVNVTTMIKDFLFFI